jgi:hypothetical protein
VGNGWGAMADDKQDANTTESAFNIIAESGDFDQRMAHQGLPLHQLGGLIHGKP